ncbi:transporter [Sphingobium sp. BHU LFT2]|uniref:transporter n=1 Tax=Sphingobium sp. BHU LFT2 TaxID=2807634 RepID=UPI001BEB975A|nr:transporter [Sphingobium sp. BHU LFT2]MBT2246114.1 transporter [Sphingobium sp. BHU LFT2]
MRKLCPALGLLLLYTPQGAYAQDSGSPSASELRELCTERPGLTTAACTVDPGHLQLEVGLADWERDKDPDERKDTLKLGDIQLRYGLAAQTEVQISWSAYVRTVTRDYQANVLERAHGIGDLTIGLKQNLKHPQEKANGLAAGMLPYITLPTGTNQGGDGDWSAGLVVPLSYKFNDTLLLAVSPRAEAAVDEDRSGRHFAYGAAAGIQISLSDKIRMSPEVEIMRDRDPADVATLASAALSLAWRIKEMTQLDVQYVAGLNSDTPDVRLAIGISRKF